MDITLLSFSMTMLLIYAAFSRYKFLNPLPFAMKEMYNSLEQPIIVLDDHNKILDFNRSFKRYLSVLCKIEPGDDEAEIISFLDENVENSEEKKELSNAINTCEQTFFSEGITITTMPFRHYSVAIRPVYINKNDCIGRFILFYDITDLKHMIISLNEKNCELAEAYRRLKEYSAVAEELSAERERNRIAHDIHDTLGQTMTILSTIINSCIISCGKDAPATRIRLETALSVVKGGLSDLRNAVRDGVPDNMKTGSLADSLNSLIKDYEASGLEVDLTLDIENLETDRFDLFLYRLCQEALTNSLRHGKAKHASIVIQTYESSLRILISDDGTGCVNIQKGYGLTGMELKVGELNGSIKYGNNGDRGFNVFILIPLFECETGGIKLDKSTDCG